MEQFHITKAFCLTDTYYFYPGFFVDINLFKANKEKSAEIAKSNSMGGIACGNGGVSGTGDLADDDANLMIKLKFLTYKVSGI